VAVGREAAARRETTLSTSKPTIDELWQKRGNFLDTSTGETVEQPKGWFPIVCGPWPNCNVGARQARCSKCEDFVGISPKGWAKHLENREERPIFCPECFELLRAMVDELNDRAPRHLGA
jgi:hypothetical protein